MPSAVAVSVLPPPADATALVPKARAELRKPPVAVALLFAPKAIAMSPTPELAVALPDCNKVAPPTEMARFRAGRACASAYKGPALAASVLE